VERKVFAGRAGNDFTMAAFVDQAPDGSVPRASTALLGDPCFIEPVDGRARYPRGIANRPSSFQGLGGARREGFSAERLLKAPRERGRPTASCRWWGTRDQRRARKNHPVFPTGGFEVT